MKAVEQAVRALALPATRVLRDEQLGVGWVGLNEDSLGRTHGDALRHCGFVENLAFLAH